MHSSCRFVLLFPLILFSVFAPSADAQTAATDLRGLSTILSPGDTIRVQDRSGREVNGRVRSISNTTLELTANTSSRSFMESDLTSVYKQESDSRSNGAWIGLAIGTATGLLAPAAFCGGFDDSECSAIVRVIFVPIGAVSGTVAGFAIDHFVHRSVLVFSSSGARAFFIEPVLTSRKRSLGFGFRF